MRKRMLAGVLLLQTTLYGFMQSTLRWRLWVFSTFLPLLLSWSAQGLLWALWMGWAGKPCAHVGELQCTSSRKTPLQSSKTSLGNESWRQCPLTKASWGYGRKKIKDLPWIWKQAFLTGFPGLPRYRKILAEEDGFLDVFLARPFAIVCTDFPPLPHSDLFRSVLLGSKPIVCDVPSGIPSAALANGKSQVANRNVCCNFAGKSSTDRWMKSQIAGLKSQTPNSNAILPLFQHKQVERAQFSEIENHCVFSELDFESPAFPQFQFHSMFGTLRCSAYYNHFPHQLSSNANHVQLSFRDSSTNGFDKSKGIQ